MKFKRIFSAILILLMSAAICLSPVLIYSENGTSSSDSSTVRTNKEDNSDEEDNSDTNSDVKSDKKLLLYFRIFNIFHEIFLLMPDLHFQYYRNFHFHWLFANLQSPVLFSLFPFFQF